MFINEKDKVWFNELWESLAKGGKHFEGDMKHVTKQGLDLWTIATYTCVRRVEGSVEKILFLAIDTTEQKKLSLDFEGQILALNRSSLKAEFNLAGEILEVNDLFCSTLNYSRLDANGLSLREITKISDLNKITRIWDDVTNGIPFEGQIELLGSGGIEKWFRLTFSAVNDMYGDVAKVVMIANDVTKETLMEIENKRQNDILNGQEEILKR